ncbi:MAG: gamma-glutamyltransferase [Myxococcota bacterium]|nr:gamma-glutamyltransferase [Myxococcota bacterium]
MTQKTLSYAHVAAGHPETCRAACEVYEAGGNAIDATLAAMTTAFAVEPLLTSPFGGGIMQLHEPGQRVPQTLPMFASVPSKTFSSRTDFHPITVSFGAADQEFYCGKGSVAVSHLLQGLLDIHAEKGNLSRKQALEPAVKRAKDGQILTPALSNILQILTPILTMTTQGRSIYAPRGSILRTGDRLLLPELEKFIRELQSPKTSGENLLYQHFAAPDGLIGESDCRTQKLVHQQSYSVKLDAFEIFLPSYPSIGGILITFGLELLRRLQQEISKRLSITQLHIGVMATTQYFRQKEIIPRLKFDPNSFEETDLLETIDWGFYLNWTHNWLKNPHPLMHDPPSFGETTHLSIVDSNDWMVSITSSNGEGCGHIIPGTSLFANNFLGEQDLHPFGFHQYPQKTRLNTMMSPCLVFKADKPFAVLGTGGSNRIRTVLLQVLSRIIYQKIGLTQAVEAPRLHFEGGPIYYEATGPDSPLSPEDEKIICHFGLETVRFEKPNMFFGGVHATSSTGEVIGDPRRGGAAKSLLL